MKNSCKMELSRNHVQGEINMLYFHTTKNLIGLQDVILKNVKQSENSIYIHVQMPRKEHICPCCGKSTDKIHDYRKQYIKDIPAFDKLTYIVLNKRRYICPSCKNRASGKAMMEDYICSDTKVKRQKLMRQPKLPHQFHFILPQLLTKSLKTT